MPERNLEIISRPYAENVRFKKIEDSYLVDEKFAVKLHKVKPQQTSLKFAVDTQTPLSATPILFEFPQPTVETPGMQKPTPIIDLTPNRRVLYVGYDYKITYQNPLVLRIESTAPIAIEGVSGRITLPILFSQRIAGRLKFGNTPTN